jgi:tripartite-type tricarboxylate transporter receptor subunit TctC
MLTSLISAARLPALLAAAVLASAALPGIAAAQSAIDYPSQPIRIVVSVPAGGGVDTATRIVAEELRQRFGQPVIVENRGGQAGNLAAEGVFAAPPDGYTLLASQPAPLTVNALLYKKLNFDPAALVPVAIMTSIANALVVRNGLPVTSVAEFIALAKASPGKLNYASQGTGTTSHLTAELFQTLTGTKLVHVPYKGTAPALNDLVAGHVDLMFTEVATSLELHRAGRVRMLAIATANRSPLAREFPTLIEAGLTDFVSTTWNAISAPPKTPAEIVAKLNAAIVAELQSPAVAQRLRQLNFQPESMNPAEAAQFIAADTRRWAAVIQSANIQPQQ